MDERVKLTVNGEDRELDVDPGSTLLDLLRDELGLTGPRRACDSGGCGCCTVTVDGRAVYSCMMFAIAARGKEVKTVEGLGSYDDLNPLQESFLENSAVQCGYCTSGMLMSGQDFLDHRENGEVTESEVREAISGVLCRCTGYQKIVDAIQQAAGEAGSNE